MPALDNSSQQTSKQPEQAVCGKLVDLSSTRRIPEYLQQTGAVNQWTLSASPCGQRADAVYGAPQQQQSQMQKCLD
ncbi:hypothetical protein WJX79_010826 [Trebouxia sp. C0005]